MAILGRQKPPPNRYELITCGLKGHALVGTDSAHISPPGDDLFVREHDGIRWHRCIRCDAWVPFDPPPPPTRDSLPALSEIEIPLRGPKLRDRYVLRLIALDRAFHVVVLVGIALAVLLFVGREKRLQHDFLEIMSGLYGSSANAATSHGLLSKVNHLFVVNPNHLYEIALAALAYAALEAVEMVGLWFAKRWAEYLTFIATIMLVPVEIYELSNKVSTTKAVTLVINLAIALYLLLAKRLFGLRGGYSEEERIRHDSAGWPAIERATPARIPPPNTVAPLTTVLPQEPVTG